MRFIKDIRARVSGFVAEQKLSSAKRTLEHQLKSILDLMDGHKEMGVPAGNNEYKLLLNLANDKINAFVAEYNSSREAVLIGVPKLRELQAMASSQRANNKYAPMAVAGVLALTAVYIYGVTIMAIGHDWYLFLTHWVNIRLV